MGRANTKSRQASDIVLSSTRSCDEFDYDAPSSITTDEFDHDRLLAAVDDPQSAKRPKLCVTFKQTRPYVRPLPQLSLSLLPPHPFVHSGSEMIISGRFERCQSRFDARIRQIARMRAFLPSDVLRISQRARIASYIANTRWRKSSFVYGRVLLM